MSYCRMGADSDLYLYRTMDNEYVFYTAGAKMSVVKTAKEALDLIKKIIEDGFMVPEHAIKRLEQECQDAPTTPAP